MYNQVTPSFWLCLGASFRYCCGVCIFFSVLHQLMQITQTSQQQSEPCHYWKKDYIKLKFHHDVYAAYLSTHTVYRYKIQFFLLFWGDMAILQQQKWIQENIIFMRFCCCFKLSKKIEKLWKEQPNAHHHQMHTDWHVQ